MSHPTSHLCTAKAAPGKRVLLSVAPRQNACAGFVSARSVHPASQQVPAMHPAEALTFLERQMAEVPVASAVIAGPGEPFADPEPTLQTLAMVRDRHPQLRLAVSTNGLGLADHIGALGGVAAASLAMHAVNVDTGRAVYRWIRPGKKTLPLHQGVAVLLENQAAAIQALAAAGVAVEVDALFIPGVNDHELETLAEKAAGLGACALVLTPAAPTDGPALEIDPVALAAVREAAARHLPVLDPLATEDEIRPTELSEPDGAKPYVAVATSDGLDVNLHLGQARTMLVYELAGRDAAMVESRQAPPPGGAADRWTALAGVLSDCRAVLCSGAGDNPKRVLAENGVRVLVAAGDVRGAATAALTGGSGAAPSCPKL